MGSIALGGETVARFAVDVEQPVVRRRKGGAWHCIDTVVIWPCTTQLERLRMLMAQLLESGDENENYLGLKGVADMRM